MTIAQKGSLWCRNNNATILRPMIKKIEAIYEQGVIRPLEPLELPEGARLSLIVTHEVDKDNREAADILAEIASLPIEGSRSTFAGRDHDSILYPRK